MCKVSKGFERRVSNSNGVNSNGTNDTSKERALAFQTPTE